METGKTLDVGVMFASEDGQRWYWMLTRRTLSIVTVGASDILHDNSLFGRLLVRTTRSIASVKGIGPTQDMSGALAERDGHFDILR